MLIVVSGLPGTGKSGIADGLSRACGIPVLSVDPIESAMLRAGLPRSFETGLAAYLVAETLADQFLANGLSAIMDAVSSVEPARDQWRALAGRHGVPLMVLECIVSDQELHRFRLVERDRSLAVGEPTPEDVEHRRAEWSPWPEPHLTLDAVQDREANLARALAWVGCVGRRKISED
jgi:predicted kinase